MILLFPCHLQNRIHRVTVSGLTNKDVREIQSEVNRLRWASIAGCIRKPAFEPLRRFSREIVTGPSFIRADEDGMAASVHYKNGGGRMDCAWTPTMRCIVKPMGGKSLACGGRFLPEDVERGPMDIWEGSG